MSYGDVWKDLLVPEKYKEKYYQNTIDFDKHPKEPSAEQLTILSKARRNTQSPSHRDRMLTFENQTNAITIKNTNTEERRKKKNAGGITTTEEEAEGEDEEDEEEEEQ